MFFFGFLDGCVGMDKMGNPSVWPKTIRKKGGFIHESHENPSDVSGDARICVEKHAMQIHVEVFWSKSM